MATKADHVVLRSANWLSMSHGAVSQSISIVTAYDTLGTSGVEHSLTQTGARAIYVDPQLLKTAAPAIKAAKDVKYVIYNDESIFATGKEVEPFKIDNPDLTVISVEELRALGEANAVEPVPPKAEDLYCIMYTSGSTGLPKGVPMSHAGILAAGEFAMQTPHHVLHRPAACLLLYLLEACKLTLARQSPAS